MAINQGSILDHVDKPAIHPNDAVVQTLTPTSNGKVAVTVNGASVTDYVHAYGLVQAAGHASNYLALKDGAMSGQTVLIKETGTTTELIVKDSSDATLCNVNAGDSQLLVWQWTSSSAGSWFVLSNNDKTQLNKPVVLIAGGAGNDTTIHSLASGNVYQFGTGTGELGNADDDDAFTFKLPTPTASGEKILVKPTNASAYAKLLGFVCNAPATETITYYAIANNVFIETASTATGTAGSENVFVKLSNSHFITGMTFEFTSVSTTSWRLDINDPLNLIAGGDIAVAAGNAGGYVS